MYQPIIGNKAVSLYLTLFNDLEKNQIMTNAYLHHHLISIMQISLEEIMKLADREDIKDAEAEKERLIEILKKYQGPLEKDIEQKRKILSEIQIITNEIKKLKSEDNKWQQKINF